MNLRNTTLSFVALSFAGGVMAQRVTAPNRFSFQHDTPSATVPLSRPLTDVGANRDVMVVFTEDFANGFAGNNGIGAWTTSGANGNVWTYSLFGPTGAYTNITQIISSPTVANGFALFASDSANTDFSNPDDLVSIDPTVSLEGSLESPVLDLSATPYVELLFSQRFRYCCQDAPQFVEVSTDAGLSWPAEFSFTVANGVGFNVNVNEVHRLNITGAIAANPESVKIRFRHSADAGTDAYHWQVDDIMIQTLEGNDLQAVSGSSSSFVYATAGTFDSLYYSVYPFNQLRGLPLNMTVMNNGSTAVTDAEANFTVTEGANELLNSNVSVPNFLPGQSRTVYVNPDFTPPQVEGTYNVAYSISSSAEDTIPNNTTTSAFKVDPVYYGRDGGSVATIEAGPDDGSEFVLGHVFYTKNAAPLYAISVLVGTGSDVGSIIVGQVREFATDYPVVATSLEVEVTSSMLNPVGGSNWTHLSFGSPYGLDANTDYFITVEAFGKVHFGVNGSSVDQTSLIRFSNALNPLNWYLQPETPCVRMNFNASVGIETKDVNSGVGMGQNLPNPANGTTTIPYTLENTARVTFEVRDMSGKLVLTSNEGIRAAGTYRLNIDTNVLSEGVYTYTMRAGDVNQTKRMTVIK